MKNKMPFRISKILMVASAALFSSLVVFNNIVDYQSNYQYVAHVMSMDTTGNASQAQWRALPYPWLWEWVYSTIIVIELAVAVLCWMGAFRMISHRKRHDFSEAASLAVYGLSLGVVLWFVAFMGISGEWFLAWQSQSWNGIQPGFRVACLFLLMLIYMSLPD